MEGTGGMSPPVGGGWGATQKNFYILDPIMTFPAS